MRASTHWLPCAGTKDTAHNKIKVVHVSFLSSCGLWQHTNQRSMCSRALAGHQGSAAAPSHGLRPLGSGGGCCAALPLERAGPCFAICRRRCRQLCLRGPSFTRSAHFHCQSPETPGGMGSLGMLAVIPRAIKLTEALWDTARAAAPRALCVSRQLETLCHGQYRVVRLFPKFGFFPDYQYTDRYNWDVIGPTFKRPSGD